MDSVRRQTTEAIEAALWEAEARVSTLRTRAEQSMGSSREAVQHARRDLRDAIDKVKVYLRARSELRQSTRRPAS